MWNFLSTFGIEKVQGGVFNGKWLNTTGPEIVSYSPISDEPIATIKSANEETYEQVLERAQEAFRFWRMVPPPKRGEIIRQIGDRLRQYKITLSKLITLETGKTIGEAEGEVQEMIDMADFSVGLSRQLYGFTMQSERPLHRLYDHWLPLGPIGVITAFNFPAAVFSWNAMIGLAAGNSIIWKPSSSTPLCGIAITKIFAQVIEDNGISDGLINLLVGSSATTGEKLIADKRVPLISATGSCNMGRRVAEVVAARLGKTILELGGNNAAIIMDDANLGLALKSVIFAAIGTSGQRCTTLRRLLIHENIYDQFIVLLKNAYKSISIGDPFDRSVLMGPLINKSAVQIYRNVLDRVLSEGGKVILGGEILISGQYSRGCWVKPAIVEANKKMSLIKEENFVPVLYLIRVRDYEEAMEIHNDVDQGLSSSIFTNNLILSERFLSAEGSDCGIANINSGTSGAELGGAFGGEKDTGGGREAGSDAWKLYMRRQTVTINWGSQLPLSQGIKFGDFSN